MDAHCDCPDGPQDVVTDYKSGIVICTGCGVVLPEVVFEAAPFSDHHTAAANDDAFIPPKSMGQPRLADPDKFACVRKGFTQIEAFATSLGLDPSHTVVNAAKEIFRDISEKRTIRDRDGKLSRKCFAACALYFGFKVQRVRRSLKDFKHMCEDIHAVVKVFKDELRDKPYFDAMQDTVGAEDLVYKTIASVQNSAGLSVDQRVRLTKRIHDIQERVASQGILEGRTPEGVLSGVIYTAVLQENLGNAVKKKHVHEACGVSGVTLNKAWKELSLNV